MSSRGRRAVVALGVACMLLGTACGSDAKARSGISIDTLAATTGTACPVPLEASASASGVDSSTPATGSVVAAAASGTDLTSGSLPGTSPIEAADAVEVDCSLTLTDGGDVDLVLIAARTEAAPEVVIPAVARVAGLTANQAQQLANDATRTKDAELVPVPGSSAVAMMPTKVGGATSAAFVVSSPTLKRAQVEQIARQLDQRLR